MVLNIISASLINAGTDQKRPLLPTRRRIYDACVKLWSWLVLLNLGYFVRVRYPISELYGKSGLWVLPHASILDVFVSNVIGGSTFVAKKHIADIPLVKPSVRATRSLIVRPNYGLFDELKERSKGDTPVVIFSEGTTTHQRCVLRLRTGAFRCDCQLQPVGIYYGGNPTNWAFENIGEHIVKLLMNNLGLHEV